MYVFFIDIMLRFTLAINKRWQRQRRLSPDEGST